MASWHASSFMNHGCRPLCFTRTQKVLRGVQGFNGPTDALCWQPLEERGYKRIPHDPDFVSLTLSCAHETWLVHVGVP